MKGFTRLLRHGLVVASLLGLAACGGGSDVNTVEISGTVTGLTTGSLSLSNGLSTVNIPVNSTTFIFPNRMNIGLQYSVFVLSQPTGYSCAILNGTGLAGYNDSTNVAVNCARNNSLGGTVSGLKASGLVLANGGSTVTVAANATTFAFTDKVVTGANFGVTVLQQPTGQVCTVSNGVGTMGPNDLNSVVVTCI